ncbi:MAG: tryptophan--tRNA ligase [Polyangiaceae bacterium]
MAVIFSGMQPTGELHLGNYLGALKQWVALSKTGQHECIFGVVDAHAFTVPYEPKELERRVFDTALAYLAAGLDERVTVMVQSEVREHTELAWYLSCVAPMGELGRMTQFKEKGEQHKESVNAGLFTYPILMAADILVYKATLVPVGADQVQHLEFARDTARHFNHRFGKDVFPEPKPHPLTLRIKGTDGNDKMSKSRNNAIGLLEDEKAIWKKLKGAFTDPQRTTREIPGRPEVCNIYTMHTAVSSPERVAGVDRDCRSAAIGCGDCKKMLAESLENELVPIRTRAAELRAAPDRVREKLAAGTDACRKRAGETLREVRDVMGMKPIGRAP